MAKNDPKWPINGKKFTKNDQNWAKMVKNCLNEQKWPKMAKHDQKMTRKWPKMVKNVQ